MPTPPGSARWPPPTGVPRFRLLWAARADTDRGGAVTIGHVTGGNQWAIDVEMAARLDLHQEGYLGLRGMAASTPHIQNGVLLLT